MYAGLPPMRLHVGAVPLTNASAYETDPSISDSLGLVEQSKELFLALSFRNTPRGF